jgi:hypothetical protein
MSPKELTAFRVDPELMEGLRAIKDRDGIPISEQVRRALVAWLESKGAMPQRKTAAARPGTKERSTKKPRN